MLRAPAAPGVDAQEGSFWLGKAVEWGQGERPESQRDASLHLGRLRAFLHTLLSHINTMGSSSESMRRMPFVGQFLGRLCWNSYITADNDSCRLLFSCLWALYSDEPADAVERKANQWIQNVLCQLATEDSAPHMDEPLTLYRIEVLKKMVSALVTQCESSCSCLDAPEESRSCDVVFPASVACVPLVTCPEAAPLIGALLRRPLTCPRAALSPDFLDAVGSAHARSGVGPVIGPSEVAHANVLTRRLRLEETALVRLWLRSLSCLEEEVLGLLEAAVTLTTRESLNTLISSSVLPKACAEHCSMFLIVSDVFRSLLMKVEGNQTLLSLVHEFTCCLRREKSVLQDQECVSLKAFFPHAPQRMLAPLLTLPTDVRREAWPDHLGWVIRRLRRLIEEEEEEEEERDVEEGSRGRCGVFEAWFLLAQSAGWVEVAEELLVSAGSQEERGDLLWLLLFYHHPASRGRRRALQLASAGEALDCLASLFLVTAPPLPAAQPKALAELLSARPQAPPLLAPLLVVSLLVNFAVFSHNPSSMASEIMRMVLQSPAVRQTAEYVLGSMEARLNSGRVHTRIRGLRVQLQEAPMEAEESCT